ncbi:uncharacterized protein LOC142175541 [Nicotiana tabacum]|uniref:Uncharacterized protein LOC142175541 n=2 Tax=Nicotiana TaxID=4085 RepID=A0AC58TN42_TOBAC|nr:PREDICTED: uncharacterized protein LOC104220366 [Nicotiana sylvestris]
MNRALPSPSQPSSSSVIQNVPLSIAEETESPPQKNHKIDEGGEKIGTETSIDDSMSFTDEEKVDDDTSSPLKTLIYSDYDSEEDYCPAGTKKMDKALWERYYKQIEESQATNYEVESVLKVNGGGCRDFIYYLTFSVKNGEHEVFQAKVVEDLNYNLEFPIVRPKVKAVNE